MRALRSDLTEALKLKSSVRREVLRALVELGALPPGLTADDLQRKLEIADLDDQVKLPSKRRPQV
jgi:hypothetical protein